MNTHHPLLQAHSHHRDTAEVPAPHARLQQTPVRSRLTRLGGLAAAAALSVSLMACSNMSPSARDTAIGATAGAVVGGVVTGTTTGAAVGAAVGSVIGNEAGKRK